MISGWVSEDMDSPMRGEEQGDPGNKMDSPLICFFNSPGQTCKSLEKAGKDADKVMNSGTPVQGKQVGRRKVGEVSVRRRWAAKAEPLHKPNGLLPRTPDSR